MPADTYGPQAPAPSANALAAVIAAGHGVAVRLYPDQRSSLDDQYHNMLATVPDSLGKNQGLALGDEAAERVIEARANDHFYEYAKTEPFGSLWTCCRFPTMDDIPRSIWPRKNAGEER